MATERIQIEINERGGRTVKRRIDSIGSSAENTANSVSLLRRALAALGAAFGLREFVQLVDTAANLRNRIGTVTDSIAELTVVNERLFEVANETRTAYEGTVEVYARVALAAKDLGTSQQELIEFTESLNQAVVIGGSSAIEARNAIIQLSQGIASGALRGDELRSVLEQLPVVADVIAESLGVTRGELRKLGEQGRITAANVLQAFAEAREELGERFAGIVPTISQSFVVLRNNLIRTLGEFDQATGLSQILSGAILTLANNMELLGRATLATSLALGLNFAGRAVPAAIAGTRALSAAILANPLGALGAAAVTATGFLVAFSDQIAVSSSSVATLQDLLLATVDELGFAFDSLVTTIRPAIDLFVSTVEEVIGPINISIASIVRGVGSAVDAIIGFWLGAFRSIVSIFSDLPAVLGELFFEAAQAAAIGIENIANTAVSAVNAVRTQLGAEAIDPVSLDVSNPFAGAGQRAGDAFSEAFFLAVRDTTVGSRAAERILAGAENRAVTRIAREQAEAQERAAAALGLTEQGLNRVAPALSRTEQSLRDYITELEREGELLLLANDQRAVQAALFEAEDRAKRALTATERERITTLVETNEALADQDDLLQFIRAPQEDYRRGLEALVALLDRGAISSKEFADEQRALTIELLRAQTEGVAGYERALLGLQEEFEDLGTQVERATLNTFASLEDTVVRFAQTGKLSFADFARSIIADLTRIAFRALFLKPILDLLLGSLGGGFGGGAPQTAALTGFGRFASGGLVSGPGSSSSDNLLARLSPGEFVVNAAATRSALPTLQAINSGQGAPAGGMVQVNIVDQRAGSAPPVGVEEETGPDGRRVLTVTIRDTIRRGISGGEFDGAMRGRFGLRPSSRQR